MLENKRKFLQKKNKSFFSVIISQTYFCFCFFLNLLVLCFFKKMIGMENNSQMEKIYRRKKNRNFLA